MLVKQCLPHVIGIKKDMVDAMKNIEPNQSKELIFEMISPFNRSTFKKRIIATEPIPIMGKLIQKIHLQIEYPLSEKPSLLAKVDVF